MVNTMLGGRGERRRSLHPSPGVKGDAAFPEFWPAAGAYCQASGSHGLRGSDFLPRRLREGALEHSPQRPLGRREAIMNFMDTRNLGSVNLLERSLDGL